MLKALSLPGFRWVATIYALDYMVELASSVALMVLVYNATDSALIAAAMLTCKQVVPGFLTALLGKVLDRVTVRQGLATAYLIFTVVLLALAATGYSALLFVLALVAGTTGGAVRALLRAAVARSTRGHDLRAANAFLNVLMGVVALLGPAAGALLVSQVGTSTTLVVSAVGALVLAATGAVLPVSVGGVLVRDVEEEDEGDEDDAPTGPRTSSVNVTGLLVLGGLVVGCFAMDEPALLAYSEHALHSGVGGYGAILTMWGVGMIVGSIIYGKLLERSMPMVFVAGAILNSLGYLGLGLSPTILVACTVCIVGGSGNGMLWVALVTAVQESAADGEQGKMAARLEGIVTATPAIGLILGGVVADAVTPRATLLIPGAVALSAIAIWALLQRGAAIRPSATSVVPTSQPISIPERAI